MRHRAASSVSLPCETGIISATFRDRRYGRPQYTISPELGAFRERIKNAGKWVSAFQETFERDDCPIAFAFGHGLGYTDFSYGDFALSAKTLAAGDPEAAIEASITVTNEGDRPGVAVPQLYLRDTVAVPAPRRLELRGFERLELQPGESARVTFKVTPDDLAVYPIDPATGALLPEHGRVPSRTASPSPSSSATAPTSPRRRRKAPSCSANRASPALRLRPQPWSAAAVVIDRLLGLHAGAGRIAGPADQVGIAAAVAALAIAIR